MEIFSKFCGLLRIYELYLCVNVCIAVCRFNLWKWWMSKHPIFIQDVSSVFTKAIGSFGKRINSIKGICRTDWIRYLINKVGLFFKKALLSKGLKATHVRFNQRPISLNHTWLWWKSKTQPRGFQLLTCCYYLLFWAHKICISTLGTYLVRHYFLLGPKAYL